MQEHMQTAPPQKFRGSTHRDFVGGRWGQVGPLQLDYMKQQGLQPHHKYFDVGCGCLRGGIHVVPYLDSGNYYGVDANAELLELGYEKELDEIGKTKLPRDHLHCTRDFRHPAIADGTIDYAIAVSLFTHLPRDLLEACLKNVAPYFRTGGQFHMTFLESESYTDLSQQPGKKTRNQFSYSQADMQMAAGPEWKADYIGNWNHPRKQMMMRYTRL